MANCLVTKLKGVVDNDNLPIYGIAKVLIADSKTYHFTESVTVKVVGGTVNGGATQVTGQDISISSVTPDGTFGNKIQLLMPKYKLINIDFIEADIADFEFSPITAIGGIGSNVIYHNISKLEKHLGSPLFTYLALNSIQPFDSMLDVTELGAGGALEHIDFGGITTNVSGSLDKIGMSPIVDVTLPATTAVSMVLENVVGYRREAGVTTGSMNIHWAGVSNTTFNGARVANKANAALSWTADTITYDGVTINA